MTLTYNYADSSAVLGPLATHSEPHAYDLCETHGQRMTVPNGWNVIRQSNEGIEQEHSDDDLMAIADAVREVVANSSDGAGISHPSIPQASVGRRGHLRSVPS
ncbi:unannotated protein [freshwater metagenome]|uniref:Unannotated protein n=1 Tax=freshwater metagenome TaxID=449393 RepID=A0A6J7XUX3_9ZZZZ